MRSRERLARLRSVAFPLRWPDVESHADGEPVTARGRVGTVTPRATRHRDVWAEFELVIGSGAPPVTCFAFPSTHRRLRTPLAPGQRRTVLARVSHAAGGPELHVVAWS